MRLPDFLQPDRRMLPLFYFFAYIAAVLIVGGLLAYPLHSALDPWLDYPFHRTTSRSIMLVALVGLIPFLKAIGSYSKAALGYDRLASDFIQDLLKALAIGTVIFLPVVFALLGAGTRVFDPRIPTTLLGFGELFLKYLPAALAIGLIEETYFRGAIFTAVRRHAKIWPAIMLTSLLYAATHFLRVRYHIANDELAWYSGLVIVSHAFGNFSNPLAMIDSFLALFCAGVFLCLIRVHTGHVGACIGIHASWVFVIKITKKLSSVDPESSWSFLAGTYDQMIGWLAFAWITLITLAYYVFFVRKTTETKG